jgi:hypothetical protein
MYVARDKNGKMHIVGGLDRTPEERQAAQANAKVEAQEVQARMAALAKNMEMDRYKRWATDPSITDPATRAAGLRGMQVMGAQEAGEVARQTAGMKAQHDAARLNLDQQKFLAEQMTAQRTAQTAGREKRLENLRKAISSTNMPERPRS